MTTVCSPCVHTFLQLLQDVHVEVVDLRDVEEDPVDVSIWYHLGGGRGEGRGGEEGEEEEEEGKEGGGGEGWGVWGGGGENGGWRKGVTREVSDKVKEKAIPKRDSTTHLFVLSTEICYDLMESFSYQL